MQLLHKENVPTRRVFVPLNQMPYLKQYGRDYTNALEIYDHGLCLPASSVNTDEMINGVCTIVKQALNSLDSYKGMMPHGKA